MIDEASGRQSRPVEATVGRVTLTGHELKAALEYLAPDGEADQLYQSLVIEWWPETLGRNEDAGYYAWHAEYPDEGCIMLEPNAGLSGKTAAPET